MDVCSLVTDFRNNRILASPEEVEYLAEGVYSLEELEELYMRRRAEEQA